MVNQQTGLYYGLGLWLREKNGEYIPFIMGEDFGISFQSSYNKKTGEYMFGVSNKNHGLWEVMEDMNQLIK